MEILLNGKRKIIDLKGNHNRVITICSAKSDVNDINLYGNHNYVLGTAETGADVNDINLYGNHNRL